MNIRLCAGLLIAASPAMASPAPAAAQAATTSSQERLVARADVDGDGRRDSVVQTTTWSADGYTARTTLTVKGSAGRTSSVHLSVGVYPEYDTPRVGVGIVDGQSGADIAVDASDNETELYRVFTWRTGRLVSLAPPESQRGHRTQLWHGMDGEGVGGFRFYTTRGVRYVERLDGSGLHDRPRREFLATLTTYKWTKNTWVPLKTRRQTMPGYEKNILPWRPFTGTGMKIR